MYVSLALVLRSIKDIHSIKVVWLTWLHGYWPKVESFQVAMW